MGVAYDRLQRELTELQAADTRSDRTKKLMDRLVRSKDLDAVLAEIENDPVLAAEVAGRSYGHPLGYGMLGIAECPSERGSTPMRLRLHDRPPSVDGVRMLADQDVHEHRYPPQGITGAGGMCNVVFVESTKDDPRALPYKMSIVTGGKNGYHADAVRVCYLRPKFNFLSVPGAAWEATEDGLHAIVPLDSATEHTFSIFLDSGHLFEMAKVYRPLGADPTVGNPVPMTPEDVATRAGALRGVIANPFVPDLRELNRQFRAQLPGVYNALTTEPRSRSLSSVPQPKFVTVTMDDVLLRMRTIFDLGRAALMSIYGPDIEDVFTPHSGKLDLTRLMTKLGCSTAEADQVYTQVELDVLDRLHRHLKVGHRPFQSLVQPRLGTMPSVFVSSLGPEISDLLLRLADFQPTRKITAADAPRGQGRPQMLLAAREIGENPRDGIALESHPGRIAAARAIGMKVVPAKEITLANRRSLATREGLQAAFNGANALKLY